MTLESRQLQRLSWKVLWERRAGEAQGEEGQRPRRGQCGGMLRAELGPPKSYVESFPSMRLYVEGVPSKRQLKFNEVLSVGPC